MRFLVEDRILGNRVDPVVVDNEILYSILPNRLLLRYILDGQLRSEVKNLIRQGKVVHPLRYAKDASFKRRLYIRAAMFNQIKKFRTFYPKPTSTGF